MRKLYCFDFDGTLTKRDTLPMFLRFCKPGRFLIQFARHLPLFVFWKLGLISAQHIKQSFISSVLKGESKEQLKDWATSFFKTYHHKLIRTTVDDFFKTIDKNADVFIVTASLDIWVEPFAEYFNAKLISTRARFKEGVFTGEFLGKNCNGQEKVNRILKMIDVSKYDKTYAFGDTRGDQQMLDWADESYFKFFA